MNEMRVGNIRSFADWLGISASTACALHCILLPTLLVTGTVLPASFLGDESFHWAMLWIILPMAVLAFVIGCRRHKDKMVLVLGIIGLTGLVLAPTILHDVIGEAGERAATVLSAAVLISAHYRNFLLCRLFDCSHDLG